MMHAVIASHDGDVLFIVAAVLALVAGIASATSNLVAAVGWFAVCALAVGLALAL